MSKRYKCWLYVLEWTMLIYSTLYVVRPLCEFLKTHTPFHSLSNIVMGILFFCVMCYFIFILRIKQLSSYILCAIIFLSYGCAMVKIPYPEEKIHLLEYGFLGFLVYKAISVDMKGMRAFLLAFLLTSLIGWGDEGIQHLLPNRYYQNSDVLLNSISGVLGLALTFVYVREKKHERLL